MSNINSSIRSALIGYSGFVGSNLDAQYAFTERYNSKNIDAIAGKSFDLVVCAGIQAMKRWANQNPLEDRTRIRQLLDLLETVEAKHFVLISTIDVYPHPVDIFEKDDPASLDNHAYGVNRYEVEKFVRENFSSHTIVRLPGLFGKGLTKNVLFDLIHNNALENINPNSSFQYYNLNNLWKDIQKGIEHKLTVLNLACEPISTKTIVEKFFPEKAVGGQQSPDVHYNMKSEYAQLWGKNADYQYDAETTLNELSHFLKGVP